ncbi:MAG: ATP-binding protein [Ghiorsea sp.]
MSKGHGFHPHTLRQDLTKDILVWAGSFFVILSFVFICTVSSLVNYMVKEIAETRLGYQTNEFSKHLSLKQSNIITEESDTLIQDETMAGVILLDETGLISHVSLHDDKKPQLHILPSMNKKQIMQIIEGYDYLRLHQRVIPNHQATLMLIIDSRPVLHSVYTSTMWTAFLLILVIGLSIKALHYSLKRHMIHPIDEVKQILDNGLTASAKTEIMDHLPSEIAVLARTYDKAHKSSELVERQIHQAQKMEAIGAVIGGIAHEINNILAGITSNVYMALKKERDSDTTRRLQLIDKLSFRAGDVIQKLLTFSRQDVVKKGHLSAVTFVEKALVSIHSFVPGHIKIEDDLSKEHISINGDYAKLQQVMVSLVMNAVDALEGIDDPTIKISLDTFAPDQSFLNQHAYFKEGAYAHLCVRDNGVGIPEAEIEHVFDPFFSLKEVGKGSGLGLSMVYGAVKSHGGFVEVETVEGKGSAFHIYLPLVANIEVDIVISEENEELYAGSGETILVVDDEACIRETSAEVFEQLNYKVLIAGDGLEAIDIFNAHKDVIEVVIMDVVMPKMGGVKAAEQIKMIKPNVKIIFATGYDKEETIKNHGLDFEDETFSKPLNILALSKTIREFLDVA